MNIFNIKKYLLVIRFKIYCQDLNSKFEWKCNIFLIELFTIIKEKKEKKNIYNFFF